jgi:hypothetical protein
MGGREAEAGCDADPEEHEAEAERREAKAVALRGRSLVRLAEMRIWSAELALPVRHQQTKVCTPGGLVSSKSSRARYAAEAENL